MTEGFPRQQARTRHFTLGLPRSFQISPSGDQVAFLRSRAGDDPETCLWVLDAGTGHERLVADPEVLGASLAGEIEQEKARRERVCEQAIGIVSFACDATHSLAAFTLAGQVWWRTWRPAGGRRARSRRAPARSTRGRIQRASACRCVRRGGPRRHPGLRGG